MSDIREALLGSSGVKIYPQATPQIESPVIPSYAAPTPANKNLGQKLKGFIEKIPAELHREHAYLLPLRLFIGLGWIRASLEKITEENWRNGSAILSFFSKQTASGEIVFSFYQNLIQNVFTQIADPLSWIIIVGQLLAGIAILTGTFTNAALLASLFMNLNFIFAGKVNPSAFYIVIQTALFLSNVGSILGSDKYLSKKIPLTLICAQQNFEKKVLWIERLSFLGLMFASTLIIGFAFPHIKDFSPASVDDPAMVLFILGSLGALSSLITLLRTEPLPEPGQKPSELSVMLTSLAIIGAGLGTVLFSGIIIFTQFIGVKEPVSPPEQVAPPQTPENKEPEKLVPQNPQKNEEELSPATPAPELYVSLLKTTLTPPKEVVIDPPTLETLRKTLTPSNTTPPTLEEIVLRDAAKLFVPLQKIGELIASSFFTSELLDNFENVYSLAVYSDTSGNWPIYILKAKTGSEESAKALAKKIETIPTSEIKNFFIKNPGEPKEWKTGKVLETEARYLVFTSDAALDYGWKDNLLIISASYAGFQETLRHL